MASKVGKRLTKGIVSIANIESCVAYHMRVWPVRQKVIEKLDKKLEKIIKKNGNKNQNEK